MPSPLKPLPIEDLEHVLEHTHGVWPEARGKTFFITGGTGFFGMWLLESFAHVNDRLDLGMRATVLTRNARSFAAKAPHLFARKDLNFVEGDVRDFAFLVGDHAYVVHAATPASAKLNEESPQEMLDTIVGGTRRVLDFASRAKTQKLLLTSSGAVYGRQPAELTHVPEDFGGSPDLLDPKSAYGLGKRVAEHMCVVAGRAAGFETKIARCFAFVGPHLPLDGSFAIGNFIRDTLMGDRICVSGDGRSTRSYLYAADLVVWLWTILFSAVPARAYNVGSDVSVSIRELADLVCSTVGGLGVDQSGRAEPLAPMNRYVPEVSRARLELNLETRIGLADAIQRTARWQSSAQNP